MKDKDEPLGLTRGQRLQSDMSEAIEELAADLPIDLPPTKKTMRNVQVRTRRIT